MPFSSTPWTDSEVAVLAALLDHGQLARTELAAHTGFSKATVLSSVERLLARGVVERSGCHRDGRPGPRASLFEASPGAAFGVAVEANRRGVAVDILGFGGRSLVHVVHPSDHHPSRTDVVTAVTHACSAASVALGDATCLVMSVGGGVHPDTGQLVAWNLPQWHREDVATGLAAELGRPVQLENDINLWAIAEAATRASHDMTDFMLLAVDSVNGTGGALVLNGALRHGHEGLAGELG